MSEPVHSAEGGTAETPNAPSASVGVRKARKAFIPLEYVLPIHPSLHPSKIFQREHETILVFFIRYRYRHHPICLSGSICADRADVSTYADAIPN